ncbi:MAG: LD-carboxypeptidase [Bacteroidia bacterium]
MTTPPYLKKGDRIAIVAPARKISPEELQPGIDVLKSWGLEVVTGKNLFHADHQFSGTDKERADDLQQSLDDPSIKAVISARGGYGTMRIIDQLNFSKFKSSPKWIIGFSDITVLHSHIHQLGIETMHAKMMYNFAKDDASSESLRKALFGEKLGYAFPSHPGNRGMTVNAPLVGGNLSLIYALNGSASDLDTNGKILFLEDLDEYYYHIDRMMLSLDRAGKLKGLAGLLVGGMTEMKDNAIPFGKNAEEIITDAVRKYNYPVCFNFPAGHIDNNNTLFLGRNVMLEMSAAQSVLSFQK